jgi:hypothetical protein
MVETWMCTSSTYICVAQDAPKTHVNCMLFETSWVVMANVHFNIFLILFLHVNQRLIVAFNMEFTCYFFASFAFVYAYSNFFV